MRVGALAVLALVVVGIVVAAFARQASVSDASDRGPSALPTPASSTRGPAAARPTPTSLPLVTASNGRPAPVAYLVGDSYSEGAGAENPGVEGYVPLLQQELGWEITAVSLPGGGYVNVGMDGSGPFSAKIDPAQVASLKPDVVILQGGLNDQGLVSRDVRAGVRACIETVRAAVPDVPIVVIGLLQPGGAGPSFVETTRADIAAVAASTVGRVTYVDMSQVTYPVVEDGIHPTSDGHRIITDAIVAALTADGLVAP